jgi:hypothetical protein
LTFTESWARVRVGERAVRAMRGRYFIAVIKRKMRAI